MHNEQNNNKDTMGRSRNKNSLYRTCESIIRTPNIIICDREKWENG